MVSGILSAARVILPFCLALAVAVLASCDSDIDREFGPSSLQGSGELPGRVITTSAPTGL